MIATTTPDRILATTLRQHRDGRILPDAVRRATRHQVITRGQAAGRATFWGRWHSAWLANVVNPAPALDACFSDLFDRVRRQAWPEQGVSATSTLVGEYLHLGVKPAAAVLGALRIVNRQRVSASISRSWCARANVLYRPAEVEPQLRPYLRPALYSTPFDRLRSLAGWVIDRVTYADDYSQWGMVDLWQSPAHTLLLGAGDCEDMALVLWSAAPLVGLPKGRLVIGTVDGEGHAWVEFPTLGLYAEATSGEVGYLGYGPSRYESWVHIHPDRCDLLET